MGQATLIFIFVTSFVVALSGAMTPGPLLAVTISKVAQRGFWAGPILVLGHGLIEIAMVAALAKGLSEVLGNSLVTSIIGLVGGAVLLAMGFFAIRQARKEALSFQASAPQSNRTGTLVVTGIVASISNPYWTIWWLTIGTTYLMWSLQLGIAGVASFYSGHILADLAWYSLVSLTIASARRIIRASVYRGILIACGLALLALGGYFIASGVKLL